MAPEWRLWSSHRLILHGGLSVCLYSPHSPVLNPRSASWFFPGLFPPSKAWPCCSKSCGLQRTNLSCRYPSDFPVPMHIPVSEPSLWLHPGPRWQGHPVQTCHWEEHWCADMPPRAAQAWCWHHLSSPQLSSGWWLLPRAALVHLLVTAVAELNLRMLSPELTCVPEGCSCWQGSDAGGQSLCLDVCEDHWANTSQLLGWEILIIQMLQTAPSIPPRACHDLRDRTPPQAGITASSLLPAAHKAQSWYPLWLGRGR